MVDKGQYDKNSVLVSEYTMSHILRLRSQRPVRVSMLTFVHHNNKTTRWC